MTPTGNPAFRQAMSSSTPRAPGTVQDRRIPVAYGGDVLGAGGNRGIRHGQHDHVGFRHSIRVEGMSRDQHRWVLSPLQRRCKPPAHSTAADDDNVQ